jgi:hypothetical protein
MFIELEGLETGPSGAQSGSVGHVFIGVFSPNQIETQYKNAEKQEETLGEEGWNIFFDTNFVAVRDKLKSNGITSIDNLVIGSHGADPTTAFPYFVIGYPDNTEKSLVLKLTTINRIVKNDMENEYTNRFEETVQILKTNPDFGMENLNAFIEIIGMVNKDGGKCYQYSCSTASDKDQAKGYVNNILSVSGNKDITFYLNTWYSELRPDREIKELMFVKIGDIGSRNSTFLLGTQGKSWVKIQNGELITLPHQQNFQLQYNDGKASVETVDINGFIVKPD